MPAGPLAQVQRLPLYRHYKSLQFVVTNLANFDTVQIQVTLYKFFYHRDHRAHRDFASLSVCSVVICVTQNCPHLNGAQTLSLLPREGVELGLEKRVAPKTGQGKLPNVMNHSRGVMGSIEGLKKSIRPHYAP